MPSGQPFRFVGSFGVSPWMVKTTLSDEHLAEPDGSGIDAQSAMNASNTMPSAFTSGRELRHVVERAVRIVAHRGDDDRARETELERLDRGAERVRDLDDVRLRAATMP